MDNKIKKDLEAIFREVYKKITGILREEKKNGLYGGKAGMLLFLFKYSNFMNEQIDEKSFNEALNNIQDNLLSQPLNFSNGILGQAWLIEYLNQYHMDSYDPDLLLDLDDLLLKYFIGKDHREIELVLGIVGFSIYFVKRTESKYTETFYDQYLSYLEKYADKFSSNKVAWRQPTNSTFKFKSNNSDIEYNLGLAHGVPGIIASLIPLLEYPEFRSRSKNLITASCNWLLSQKLNDSKCSSHFSSCSHLHETSRLGWCYGDLTISLTIIRAGISLNCDELYKKGLEIALSCCNRDINNSAIYDAGICHGWAGLALIFKYIYTLTSREEFLYASNKWLDLGIENYRKIGVKSLYSYVGADEGYIESAGLLTGFSGIALCLMALSKDEYDWLDCLLMK